MLSAGAALAEAPGLGKPITEADIKAWDIDVLPDGTNLPAGSGTRRARRADLSRRSARACHGEKAASGGPALRRWSATAKFDTHRCAQDHRQLLGYADDAVRLHPPRHAVEAAAHAHRRRGLRAHRLLLSLNKLIGENDVMNAQTLPKVKMPNAGNFIIRFPDRI